MTDTTIRRAVAEAISSEYIKYSGPDEMADAAISAYRAALEAEGFVVVRSEPAVGQTETMTCRCGRITGRLTGCPGDPPFKGLALDCGQNCRPTDPGAAAMREGEL